MTLTEEERTALERWAKGEMCSPSLALRSRIVLRCAEGFSDSQVADFVGAGRSTVGKWRRRFLDAGLDGLAGGSAGVRQETTPANPRHGAVRSQTDRGDERHRLRELHALLTQARAAVVGARAAVAGAVVGVVAATSAIVGLTVAGDSNDLQEAQDQRRYVDRIAWWDEYSGRDILIRLANRSMGPVQAVLVGDRSFDDGGANEYAILVGNVAPCSLVTLKIQRQMVAERPDYEYPFWKTGWLTFWDPVGYWTVRDGVKSLQLRREEAEVPPLTPPGPPTETYLMGTVGGPDGDAKMVAIKAQIAHAEGCG